MFTINNILIENESSISKLSNQTKEEGNIISFLEEWFDPTNSISSYTSGSTGKPKLIELPKSAVLKSAEITCSYFNIQKGNTALLCLPTNFIAGKLMLIRALYSQMHLTSVPPTRNPLKNNTSTFDFVAMTPMQVRTLIQENPEQLNNIKTLIIGGAPVDEQLENQLKQFSTNCYATFGMTETITHIAVRKINQDKHYSALPTITFEQTNDNCLIINAPHLPQQQLVTNDKIELLSKTTFIWKGRKDNVINTGGIKIQAEVLEKKIAQLTPNNRLFIATESDKLLGNKIILIVESESPFVINFDSLDKYETPKNTYWIPQFEETETGKINRKKTLAKIKNHS